MDHETIRERLGGAIPLNALLGLVITSIGDGTAEVRLPFRREVTNHVGGVHATAIFGVAEAASAQLPRAARSALNGLDAQA